MPKQKKNKDNKIFENLSRITIQYIEGKAYVPSTEAELIERLGIIQHHIPTFQKVLEGLLHGGKIKRHLGRYTFSKDDDVVVQGILRLHPRGFGFLQVDQPSEFSEDIFIPKHLTHSAVDGDKVEVLVNTEVVSDKGPEGRVITILDRSRTHLAGIITSVPKKGQMSAYAPLLGESQIVNVNPSTDFNLRAGDRVVMKVLDWGSKDKETKAEVSQHIGHISDPSLDIRCAVEEFELHEEFPNAVIQEAMAFGKSVPLSDLRQREDFRKIECFTIDPDTAMDFDDALSVCKKEDSGYRLIVHIADVTHYVKAGSPLDKEALVRCNSTYFPGKCVPMLPKELSNNLCSLRPNVNRLTVSVDMNLDKEGNLLNYRIVKGVIKSKKRFTYKEAKGVLDGKRKSPHLATLQLMVELCHHLKKKRFERGNIEFSIPETVVLVDDEGRPTGTEVVEYDITHQLVEEFMLKANEVIATHLTQQGKLLTYRIHDAPPKENIEDFVQLAGAFGFKLPNEPTPKELQELFEEALQTSYGPYLSTCYIRKMRLAMYSPENIGHYGLALTHYCHFTSPIRRYADLVVHRILFEGDLSREELEMISKRCSEQERLSANAENNVILLKKLRLLQANFKNDRDQEYEAIITRVKPFGIFFEITGIMVEGFLHVSAIGNDYYVYNPYEEMFEGEHTGMTYHTGDRLTVCLNKIDLIYLQTDWSLVRKLTYRSKPQGSMKKRKLGSKKTKKNR